MRRFKSLISKFKFTKNQKNWLSISFLNLRNKRITILEFLYQFWSIFRHRRLYFEDTIIQSRSKNLDSEKTLYIIRRTPPASGLFSNFHLVLSHVIFATKNNYDFYIDYEKYSNFYLEKDLVNGHSNSWNYYFTQPLKNLADIKNQYKKVLLSSENKTENIYSNFDIINSQSLEVLTNQEQLEIYKKVFKNNIYFNKETINHLESLKKSVFKDKKNILGISIRGTDYVKNRYPGHYIPPTIKQLCLKVDKYIDVHKPDLIFASTEDTEYLEKLSKKYGKKIIFLKKDRYSLNDIPMYKIKNNKYKNGLDYLSEIWLLSQCDYIIGSPNGGFNASFILKSGNFKNQYIFDLGKYPNIEKQLV